jgi:ABC-2 type transport system ATP-binding protein
MIDVTSLTRYYGRNRAVDDVSFAIGERAIVGLLGHNGAGKTTVMKMLSGFLEPSSGRIRIAGHDIETHRREIQRKLGYLPENLPVYPEMTIADYLDYAAALKGLRGTAATRSIRRAIEATELGARLFDPIGNLSRGFKQRVGVAQAILGEPELLILDEPGNGLDPEQNEHMRTLIRELSTTATVILSTHIMQEVDALCDRVLVLVGGRLALDDTMANLRVSRRLLLRASAEGGDLADLLRRMPQVSGVEALPADEQQLSFALQLHEGTDMDRAAGNIARAVIENGGRLYQLKPEQRDLEQVFRDAVQAAGGRRAA